jgi:hypothetical protein
MFTQLWDYVCRLSREANLFGLNVPMVKDPKTGTGSVSLTLVFISSALVVVGVVGKWSGFFGIIDIDNALEFFYASSALYFGRKWTNRTKGKNEGDDSSTAMEKPPTTE